MPADDLFEQRIALSPRCWITWGLMPAVLSLALTVVVFASLQQVALRDHARRLIDVIDPMLDRIGAELMTVRLGPGAPSPQGISLVWVTYDDRILQARFEMPDGRVVPADLPALPKVLGLRDPASSERDAGERRGSPIGVSTEDAFSHWILPMRDAVDGGSPRPRAPSEGLLGASRASERHAYRAGASMNGPQLWQAFRSWLPGALGASLIAAGLGLANQRRRLGERDAVRLRLAQAMANDEFEAHLQPLVDTDTGRLIGAEMLMRWNHPSQGLLLPARFLEPAAASGLLTALTEHCFRKLASRLDSDRNLPDAFLLCVNFQAHQLLQDEALPTFTALARPGGRRWYTVLELPAASLGDAQIRNQLAALQAAGFLIALDDFQTAVGAHAGLERQPVDMVKLAPDLLTRLDADPTIAEKLNTVTDHAATSGLRLVAKGVETADQRRRLSMHHLTIAQGRAVGEPMPWEAFAERWFGARPPRSSGPAETERSLRQAQTPPDTVIAAGG